jgi:hypothetical protein
MSASRRKLMSHSAAAAAEDGERRVKHFKAGNRRLLQHTFFQPSLVEASNVGN